MGCGAAELRSQKVGFYDNYTPHKRRRSSPLPALPRGMPNTVHLTKSSTMDASAITVAKTALKKKTRGLTFIVFFFTGNAVPARACKIETDRHTACQPHGRNRRHHGDSGRNANTPRGNDSYQTTMEPNDAHRATRESKKTDELLSRKGRLR